MSLSILAFLIYSLATFRLAVLLSQDTGPAHVFLKLRAKLKREAKEHAAVRKTFVHEGIECLRCSSIWVAIPVAMFGYFHRRIWEWLAMVGDITIIALAYSSVAILLNRIPKR